MNNKKMKIDPTILLLSLFIGVLIIVADSFIDAYYFQKENVLEQLFNPNLFEIYVRGLIIIIILIYGSIVSRVVYKLRFSETEKSKIISDLQKANEEITILRGILPICSFCKKIKDDKGDWNQIESYITKHTEAEFSHGLCPECAKKHYPKYFQDRRD